jgi:ABC-type molybdate transport system substrate-binding protein
MADVQSEDKATIPTEADKMVANDLVLAVQNENSQKILEIWASLVTDQERTVATWSLLQSQTRRYINKLVKESNQ